METPSGFDYKFIMHYCYAFENHCGIYCFIGALSLELFHSPFTEGVVLLPGIREYHTVHDTSA
jgi:hypothetical protein